MKIRVESVYYQIFKFECYVRAAILYPLYPFFGSPVVDESPITGGHPKLFREYLLDQTRSPRRTLAGNLVTSVLMFLLLTPWNLLCGILKLNDASIYWSGWVAFGVLAFFMSVKASNPKKYMKEFQKQEMNPQAKLGRNALLSVAIAVGVCAVFMTSFVFYLRSITNRQA